MSRVVRRAAALCAVVLVLAACGPRFDVAELEATTTGTQTVEVPLAGGETTGGATGQQPTTDGAATDEGTVVDVPATEGDDGAAPADSSGAAGQPDAQDGADDTGDAADDQASTPTQSAVDPGPSPGVSDTPCGGENINEDLGCIKIGVLVPESGAAPVPSDFRQGVSLYWYEKAAAGGTNGRQVELIVRDTTSQPNTARTRALELLQEGVFTIVSLDRLEVHDAIGKAMEQAGVPHIMVQAPTPTPSSWVNTFVISIDHTEQGRAVARYYADDLGAADGAKAVGFVREQTSALKPGTDAFEAEGAKLGLDIVARETIDPSQTSFTPTVLSVCGADPDIVWLYMAPTAALIFMQQAASQNCNPIWFANSISWNLDLAQGNPAAPADSRAFSPWVSLQSNRAADYRAAAQKYNGNSGEDLGLAAWGLNEVIDSALEAAGPALGRNTFRSALENLNATYDVWAPIDCRGGPPYVCTNSVAVYTDAGQNWEWTGSFRTFP